MRAVDLSVTRFRAATSGPSLSASLPRVGTVVHFSLSERASVRFTVARAKPGRKVGTSCVKPTAANSGHRSCTRWVRVRGSFSTAGAKGANAVTFRGRVGGETLKPHRYRLNLRATDKAGNRSLTKRAVFTIVP